MYAFDLTPSLDGTDTNGQTFYDEKDVDEAIEAKNGAMFEQRKIVVQRAGEKDSRAKSKGPKPDDECFRCKGTGHW